MKYEIKGGSLPVLVCQLDANEKIYTEAGAMSWMSANMEMATSTRGGGIGKMFGRMMSGESIFQNIYTSKGTPGMIAFASCFPGSIVALNIQPGQSYIVQKHGYLACSEGVEVSVAFQKKVSVGLFGGEGFIMQKLAGEGIAFVEIDGNAMEYQLGVGESMIVNTGYVAYMEDTCTMDIKTVSGMKNALFGGEGLVNTVVTGPGKVVLQTMPISNVAQALRPYFPTPTETSN